MQEGASVARQINVLYEDSQLRDRAANIADRVGGCALLVTTNIACGQNDTLHLRLNAAGLSLVRGKLSFLPDLATETKRLTPDKLRRELLVRAAAVRNNDDDLLAIDATAGLGADALLLAGAGFTVDLYERNPVISVLLENAIERAQNDADCKEIASRLVLHFEDSVLALPHYNGRASVVYLDPMFPKRTKAAAVKKKFQLLHDIEQPCTDEQELFEAALAAKPQRIIVKRPIKGPYLAGVKPHHSLKGKAVRYDCIEPLSLSKNQVAHLHA